MPGRQPSVFVANLAFTLIAAALIAVTTTLIIDGNRIAVLEEQRLTNRENIARLEALARQQARKIEEVEALMIQQQARDVARRP